LQIAPIRGHADSGRHIVELVCRYESSSSSSNARDAPAECGGG
jgi:hypothetical protein